MICSINSFGMLLVIHQLIFLVPNFIFPMKCKMYMIGIVAILVVLSISWSGVVAQPQVPCYFIFGDSIVDNGNNNNVPNTDAKANFAPYGIDLPGEPLGRFTNGRTVADIIGGFLGFGDFIPPFLTARGNDTRRGVNYASGGAGIRDETGDRRGVTSLGRQIQNHILTISTLRHILGILPNKPYLNRCIYSVYIGSNDYLNNYFKPDQYPTSRVYTPEQYATVLATQLSLQLKTLYLFGARKVVLNGLGSIGCIPLRLNGTSCAVNINSAAALFNARVKELAVKLNRELPGAKFTYINGQSNTTLTFLRALTNYGPCCEVRSGEELCVPSGNVCNNRDQYLFWDAVHPTEATNMATATVAYNSTDASDASPCNIMQLAQL